MDALFALQRWLVVIGFILSLLIGVVGVSAAKKSPHDTRSLWVWSTQQIVRDPIERQEFFRFLAAPKGSESVSIDRIFVAVSWAVTGTSKDKENLRKFVVEAHQRGIAVEFLAGERHWVLPYAGGDVRYLLSALASWQRSSLEQNTAGEGASFDGLQLDVEPYLLPGWPSPELMEGWKKMADQVRSFLDDNPDLGLAFGLALPVWLDQGKYGFLNEHLQAATDYVALMDYRDSADRIVRDATGELQTADRLGRKVIVGVETKDVTGDPPTITFFQEGNAWMERELGLAKKEFGRFSSFGGFAIHHYGTYRELKP